MSIKVNINTNYYKLAVISGMQTKGLYIMIIFSQHINKFKEVIRRSQNRPIFHSNKNYTTRVYLTSMF